MSERENNSILVRAASGSVQLVARKARHKAAAARIRPDQRRALILAEI